MHLYQPLYYVKLFCVIGYLFDVNGLTEFEENESNDTLACEDDAHKVILCTPSLFPKIDISNFTSKPFLEAG